MDQLMIRQISSDTRLEFKISRSVYRSIMVTVGYYPAEQGGILGGFAENMYVTHFYFDQNSDSTALTYTPQVVRLNQLLACKWNPAGIRFLGFVHSHPNGASELSEEDIEYAKVLLQANAGLPYLALPLILRKPYQFIPYVVLRQQQGISVEIARLKLV